MIEGEALREAAKDVRMVAAVLRRYAFGPDMDGGDADALALMASVLDRSAESIDEAVCAHTAGESGLEG